MKEISLRLSRDLSTASRRPRSLCWAIKFVAAALFIGFGVCVSKDVAFAVSVGGGKPLNIASSVSSEAGSTTADNCGDFNLTGALIDGYLVQHGGKKVKARIPVDYLLFPEIGSSFPKEGDGTANFNFDRNTLKPYSRARMRGKIVDGKEEWISFLVTSFLEMDEIARITINVLSGRMAAAHVPTISERPVSENLYQVLLPETAKPKWQDKNLFLGRGGGSITDVISCSTMGSSKYPHCEQITRLGHFDVKISYPLDQLRNWGTTKQNVRVLLHCMTN